MNTKDVIFSTRNFSAEDLHKVRHYLHDRREGLLVKAAINADRIAGRGNNTKAINPTSIMLEQAEVESDTDMLLLSLICEVESLRKRVNEKR